MTKQETALLEKMTAAEELLRQISVEAEDFIDPIREEAQKAYDGMVTLRMDFECNYIDDDAPLGCECPVCSMHDELPALKPLIVYSGR